MNINNPYEENLQKPLEKYGRNITDAAKDGKVVQKSAHGVFDIKI